MTKIIFNLHMLEMNWPQSSFYFFFSRSNVQMKQNLPSPLIRCEKDYQNWHVDNGVHKRVKLQRFTLKQLDNCNLSSTSFWSQAIIFMTDGLVLWHPQYWPIPNYASRDVWAVQGLPQELYLFCMLVAVLCLTCVCWSTRYRVMMGRI